MQAPRPQGPAERVLPDAGMLVPMAMLRGFGVGDGLAIGPTGEDPEPQPAARIPSRTATASLSFILTHPTVFARLYRKELLSYSETEHFDIMSLVPNERPE